MFLLSRDHVLELHHLHLQPHLLHPHLLQALQVLDVDLLNGRVIITVTMKTTMQIVNMMVEIVVEMMSIHSIVKLVNVLNFQVYLIYCPHANNNNRSQIITAPVYFHSTNEL